MAKSAGNRSDTDQLQATNAAGKTRAPRILPIVAWGPIESIVTAILIYIVPQAVALTLLSVMYQLSSGQGLIDVLDSGANSQVTLLIYTVIAESLSLLCLYMFLRYKKSSWRDLGFRKPKRSLWLYVLGGYALYFVLLIVGLMAADALFPSFNINQAQETGYEGGDGVTKLLPLVGLVFIPPFVEEVLFRGFLYQGLRTKLGMWSSAIIVSVIFGLAHQQWNVAIDTFILSMVMVYIFEKTGSLWATIALHMLKNSIAFVALFLTR